MNIITPSQSLLSLIQTVNETALNAFIILSCKRKKTLSLHKDLYYFMSALLTLIPRRFVFVLCFISHYGVTKQNLIKPLYDNVNIGLCSPYLLLALNNDTDLPRASIHLSSFCSSLLLPLFSSLPFSSSSSLQLSL